MPAYGTSCALAFRQKDAGKPARRVSSYRNGSFPPLSICYSDIARDDR